MIRVMVVDDSPLVRKIATDILNSDPEIEVVATASSAEFAIKKLNRVNPDVITMDIEMPGMGGLSAIKYVMENHPVPIIVLSAFAKKGAELTIQALENGAVDFIAKPALSLSGGLDDIAEELVKKVKNASGIKVCKKEERKEEIVPRLVVHRDSGGKYRGDYEIVAIGTSTGGPVALKTVLAGFPSDFPVGIVVVQHMPPVFTGAFASRLDSICELNVKEAIDGDPILPGHVIIAPGDYHMTVSKNNSRAKVLLHKWEPVSGHRPSVDVLMHSVAREFGNRAIGVIMTGMGKDGAEGIKELHKKGGYIIAQDKETSVIYGMNRAVIENGDADEVAPVEEISRRIINRVYEGQKILKK